MKKFLILFFFILTSPLLFAKENKKSLEGKFGKLEITIDGKSTIHEIGFAAKPIVLLDGRVACGANEVATNLFRITCLADKVEAFTVVSCDGFTIGTMMGILVDRDEKVIGLKYFCKNLKTVKQ